MSNSISSAALSSAVSRSAVAIRVARRLQPAGGKGDKVFPPTYGVDDRAPHKYCVEKRRMGETEVDAVVLDSVQSQANRMEEALLAGWRRKELSVPVVTVDFSNEAEIADIGEITSLEAPHRLADAILRDSVDENGTPFRLSKIALPFTDARVTNASPLYAICPTALVLGLWDSTGPRGGMGAKFARALVSEIVGFGAVTGKRTASRIDPLQIQNIAKSDPIYESASSEWTLNKEEAKQEKGKAKLLKTGRASEINHGNIAPSIDERAGGVTIDYALQTVVLSLAALRRLRFPTDIAGTPIAMDKRPAAEDAARTVLAALALAAVSYQQENDHDLRSRCLLIPEQPLTFELLGRNGEVIDTFALSPQQAAALLSECLEKAAAFGLSWPSPPGQPVARLKPSPKLVQLIKRSRAIAMSSDQPVE